MWPVADSKFSETYYNTITTIDIKNIDTSLLHRKTKRVVTIFVRYYWIMRNVYKAIGFVDLHFLLIMY